MEDFILKEIDKLGEMLRMIARKLGVLNGNSPDYTLANVKEEFGKSSLPFDLDTVLQQNNPVWYLTQTAKFSDSALETFIEILFHSDLDEDKKAALLDDALAYLDGKGNFSFKLHSLSSK